MPFVKQANQYIAFLYPNNTKNLGRINLYLADGYKLYILFQQDALSSNSYNPTSKIGVAYERIDAFSRYEDLLRNEKPIRVTINPEEKSFVVYTGTEPVGEEEGAM